MRYNPLLKAFVRLDAKGFPTAQIVYRKHMPKIGRWMEIQSDSDCCTSSSTTTTTTT